MRRGSLFFAAGLLAALAAGWVAFPRVLYVRQAQPLEFRHKTHAEKSGSAKPSPVRPRTSRRPAAKRKPARKARR